MNEFKLPNNFLMGCATAALQIEGGDQNNNWYRWCELKHIKDGTHCIRANDHWNRYRDDIIMMKNMNHDTYRMGLEWSRIEPQEGRFSQEAISHYRDEIKYLIENGIKPLVTLHHFSQPLWFDEINGWENPKAVFYFQRFTEFVVENIGELVCDWITINEPNVFVIYGYLDGTWPPGKKSISEMFRVLKHMTLAHIAGYRTIHRVRTTANYPGKTLVGVANHLRIFDPETNNPFEKLIAKLYSYLFQDLVMDAMSLGKFKFPLGLGGYPEGKGPYCDFIGINYYSRDIIKFSPNPGRVFGVLKVKENAQTNDLGWEIYPDGLYRICRSYYEKYQLPIFITENGICDEHDKKRVAFIYEHLLRIARLIDEGIPVQRYYHWTLVDNFEWLEGERARFGLVQNDYPTQQRTLRPSGQFYAEICRYKAVTSNMIKQYLNSVGQN